mgnify:CR=1 FL=1
MQSLKKTPRLCLSPFRLGKYINESGFLAIQILPSVDNQHRKDFGPTVSPERLLLGPGPSNADPAVLKALSQPPIGHLDPFYVALMSEVQELLRYAWQTSNRLTLPMSGTGSAAMEATLANVVEPEDTVLVAIKGYFGHRLADMAGRYQADVKTIAAALPNDPEVYKNKGGKKSMYKNMMEAKFKMIVEPIAKELLDESILKYVDEKAFVSFVTLHEVSHTLGTRYVIGKEDLTVRKALEERYSPIEECKADILSMHNHKILFDLGVISEDDINKAKATFLAGLYRSLRFGMESAHGQANLIQLNYLKKSGAIVKENGKYKFNDEIFFAKVAELANLILTCQANGDYDQAGKIMDEFRVETDELKAEIEQLKNIPRDISTTYIF